MNKTLKMKAACSPETSVNFYQPTQQNIPDNSILHAFTAAINDWNQIILVLKCSCPIINCMETKKKFFGTISFSQQTLSIGRFA